MFDFSSFATYNGSTLQIVVWSMFAGVVVGVFAVLYNKNVLGSFIKALNEHKAFEPDTARSLKEMGFSKNIFVRFALREHSSFRKTVHAVSIAPAEAAVETPEKEVRKKKAPHVPVDSLRFYLPAEATERAELLYSKNGANLLTAMAAILLFLVVAILCFTVVPDLLQMLGNFVDHYFPDVK